MILLIIINEQNYLSCNGKTGNLSNNGIMPLVFTIFTLSPGLAHWDKYILKHIVLIQHISLLNEVRVIAKI